VAGLSGSTAAAAAAAAELLEAKGLANVIHIKFKEENRSDTICTNCIENISDTNAVKTSSCFQLVEALWHKTGDSGFDSQ
jgi:hypothetical protein